MQIRSQELFRTQSWTQLWGHQQAQKVKEFGRHMNTLKRRRDYAKSSEEKIDYGNSTIQQRTEREQHNTQKTRTCLSDAISSVSRFEVSSAASTFACSARILVCAICRSSCACLQNTRRTQDTNNQEAQAIQLMKAQKNTHSRSLRIVSVFCSNCACKA